MRMKCLRMVQILLSASLFFGIIACKPITSDNSNDNQQNKDDDNPNSSETVKTPVFSVASGKIEEGTLVTITCDTNGATIYYTINGDIPTITSSKYINAIRVNESMTIKAIAIKEGMENSAVADVTYTVIISSIIYDKNNQPSVKGSYPKPEAGDVYYIIDYDSYSSKKDRFYKFSSPTEGSLLYSATSWGPDFIYDKGKIEWEADYYEIYLYLFQTANGVVYLASERLEKTGNNGLYTTWTNEYITLDIAEDGTYSGLYDEEPSTGTWKNNNGVISFKDEYGETGYAIYGSDGYLYLYPEMMIKTSAPGIKEPVDGYDIYDPLLKNAIDYSSFDGVYVSTILLLGRPANRYVWVISGNQVKMYEAKLEITNSKTYEMSYKNYYNLSITKEGSSFTINSGAFEDFVYELNPSEKLLIATDIKEPGRYAKMDKVLTVDDMGTCRGTADIYWDGVQAILYESLDNQKKITLSNNIETEGCYSTNISGTDSKITIEGITYERANNLNTKYDYASFTVEFSETKAIVSDIADFPSSYNPKGTYIRYINPVNWKSMNGKEFVAPWANIPETDNSEIFAFVPNKMIKIVNTSPKLDFYISNTEVTYSRWYEVYQWAIKNGYFFQNLGREGSDGEDGAIPKHTNLPVTRISWRDAIIWCNAASQMEGLQPVYYLEDTEDLRDVSKIVKLAECYQQSKNTQKNGTNPENNYNKASGEGQTDNCIINSIANGYRLPYESEWEYAAQGGKTYSYSGSSTITEVGWYKGNCTNTKEVGTKKENLYSLYDMSGNVCEYCWNFYNSSDTLNPYSRVTRGGGFYLQQADCAINSRKRVSPLESAVWYGFRVVQNASAN